MYVFGIDLPIMELLFIVGLLFLIALIVIWLEIRKLRKLLLTGEKNIGRFEDDIKKLENSKKLGPLNKPKMDKTKYGDPENIDDLRGYIKKCVKSNYPKNKIIQACIKEGWNKNLVKRIIEKNK